MHRIAGGLVAALCLSMPAVAAPPEKGEKASVTVKKTAKAFAKLPGYRVSMSIEGGKAKGESHDVFEKTVKESYTAEVRGKVMHVTSPVAYRLRGDSLTGAIQNGANWKDLLATDDGRLIARLFSAPEALLGEVVKFRKQAEWIKARPGDEAQVGAPDPAPEASADEADGKVDAPQGTRERDGQDGGQSETRPEPEYHRVRVTLPAQVAITHFTRLQNSGCFSEG